MDDEHVHLEEFLLVMDEYAERPWRLAFKTHLHNVQNCPECRRRLLNALQLDDFDSITSQGDPVSAMRRRHRQLKGAMAVAWIEAKPPEERLALIRSQKTLKNQVVLLGLLDRARELWIEAPQKALGFTELALAMLPKLIESKTDDNEKDEVHALAWAYHGNVLRILSDLREADRAFRKAGAALSSMPCDDLVVAEVNALKASLRRAQRRYAEAQAAVDKAIRLYGESEEWHLQGQELLTSASIRCETGDHVAALADLHRAEPLLDIDNHPRLQWVAASLHLHLLCETGRYAEARDYVPLVVGLAASHGGISDLLRVRWCEGRIAAALGPARSAEEILTETRDGFIDLDMVYEAALVSLDLAVLYAEQERIRELQVSAQQMVTIFEAHGVEREALAAAVLFCGAVQHENLTVETLRELQRWLKANRAA